MKVYYKLIIEYDGTDYWGWQEQKSGMTVSGTLKDAFKSIFKRDISIVGASRTDAGVHAKKQIARIRTDLNIPAKQLQHAWNRGLPDSIFIKNLTKISNKFHPQINVKQKTYVYTIFLKRPSPFISRYGYFYEYPINILKLKKCLQIFIGKHDFRSFCTGYDMKTTIKSIDSISVKKNKNSIKIVIKGESFLRHMIRRIVGASLEVASRENLDENIIKKILENKSAQHTLPTAPAKGLILEAIQYKPQI